MSEFTYDLPFSNARFLEVIIKEGKRRGLHLPWHALEHASISLEDLGYSYYVKGQGQSRWNAAGIYVHLKVPEMFIEEIDNSVYENEIIAICNDLVPPEVGYDFKGVKFIPDYTRTIEELEQESPSDILDGLIPDKTESINVLIHEIKRQLEDNPTLALDRLHTFSIRFFKVICDKHGLPYEPDESLHVLYATYKRHLESTHQFEASMTGNIIRVTQNIWNEFNTVRNNQTYAHDNPVLNALESKFVCTYILNLLKFINDVEHTREEAFPW